MKKKLIVLMICAFVVAAFALTGCNGGNGTAEATTQAAAKNDPPSLEVVINYADQNSDFKNIEVFLDGESVEKLKDCSGMDTVYANDAKSHTVKIVNSDDSKQISESSTDMDKSKKMTFTINKDSVDVAIEELEP